MEKFKLTQINNIPFIESDDFRMNVQRNRKLTEQDNGAILEATLYKITGTFVPETSYIFEVVDKENQPIYSQIDVDKFDSAIVFFFNAILNTEYFVKSTPQYSSLNTLYKNKIFSCASAGYADLTG